MKKVSEIKMMPNWVLVKVKEDYETYQIGGKDTKIYNPLSVGTAGQRMNITGTVLGVPNELRYSGNDLKAWNKIISEGESTLRAEEIKRGSNGFDVPMELSAGDEVLYLYKNQIDSYQNGMVMRDVDCGGSVMIMKYDTIRAIIKGEDELYPLQGRIFIEPLELKSESSLEIITNDKHMGMKINRKPGFGRVVEAGAFCNGYLDFPDSPADDRYPLKKGDIVYYDGRMANHLQFDLHQTFKTKRLMLSRKDVLGVIEDKSMFEFVN